MSLCGRAELVRILGDEDKDVFLADLVGYQPLEGMTKLEAPPKPRSEPSDDDLEPDFFKPISSVIDWAPLPFYRAESFEPYQDELATDEPTSARDGYNNEDFSEWLASVTSTPRPPLLAPWPRLQRTVSDLLKEQVQSRRLDVDAIVREVSRGQIPRTLPFRLQDRWPRRLHVVVDRSRRMTPFWHDQDVVMMRLRRRLGRANVLEFRMYDGQEGPIPVGRARQRNVRLTGRMAAPMLVLGDCGSLTDYPPLIRMWQQLARALQLEGLAAKALVPAPPSRWAAMLLRYWNMAPWERSHKHGSRRDPSVLSLSAQRLLSLVSPAIRVEPGLLRTVRRLLPPSKADAGTEADVWSHPDLSSGSSVAFTLSKDARENLRILFEEEDDILRSKVLDAIQHWHDALPEEIWLEELALLPEDDRGRYPEDEVRLKEHFLRIAETILNPGKRINSEYISSMRDWCRRLESRTRTSERLWTRDSELGRKLHEVSICIHRDKPDVQTPVGYDPRCEGDAGQERIWTIRQVGQTLQVAESGNREHFDKSIIGSTIALLRSTRPFLHCVTTGNAELAQEGYLVSAFLDPDTGKMAKESLTQPNWANAIGRDECGLWATFQYGDVRQRMRYIEPGKFMMGSPESEMGRWHDEKQHQVTLTRGYWLFDTPVTQALWQAVMGDKRSHFKGDDRPVEQVSWNGCRKFIKKLNREMPGLDLQLPTEAQWEYACRAGTNTATYAGDLENETKSSVLTDIAWYSANSGSKTHPVGRKKPNPWGLHDMLGNVYEWCADRWLEDLGGKAEIYPTGPKKGARRVIRGGGWINFARDVRAASRDYDDPGYRDDCLGFRCARVQGPADGDGGADAQAVEVPAGKGSESMDSGGTKYVIKPEQGVSIVVPQGRKIQLQTDQGRLTISSLTIPDWADAMGRDRFGLWLSFKYSDVTQRMRWIPPGQFVMGSPEGESGRYGREKRHLVTLTRGYWLFDTPVTQALWQAVMGDNPSEFKSPARPIETVSWEESGKFIEKLNGEMPGVDLRLPTEAQWEYACRAGTSTAAYTGDLEIKGENNAPLLDDIAWYGGNSGVDFELDSGWDSSDWPEKQYDHKTAGTHLVGQRKPNPWGLYDMLGNVYEWCEDWYVEYSGDPTIDPRCPEKGTNRVIRGGSWNNNARNVRAAYRNNNDPGNRNNNLGFRCARAHVWTG